MPASPLPTNPAGDDRNPVAVEGTYVPTFGDKLNEFWEKNSKAVIALCVLILLGVLAKGLWEYMSRQKELDIEKAYAAATTSDQLKTFSAAHAQHSLGGIAQLRLADEAYAAGKFAEAITGYDAAFSVLKGSPLAARIQMGRSLAKIQSGKVAEGSTELKQLLDDANQLRAIRAEAGYHLASLAGEARDSAQVQKISEQLLQIDPSSLWTQRALTLRMTQLVESAPTAAPVPAAKPADAAPGVQLNLPGK